MKDLVLAALAARGYVNKDIESGKYRLTMRLFEVGSRVVGGMNLVSLARPYLEHLAAITNEAIHLVVRDGDEVVYLYKEDLGDSSMRMASFVGLRTPMYCTAVGKSILSRLPESEVAAIWRRTVITRFTPNTIVDYADLIADLVTARQNGWAADREEHELGVTCIGAPLLDLRGAPFAAISVTFWSPFVPWKSRSLYTFSASKLVFQLRSRSSAFMRSISVSSGSVSKSCFMRPFVWSLTHLFAESTTDLPSVKSNVPVSAL